MSVIELSDIPTVFLYHDISETLFFLQSTIREIQQKSIKKSKDLI